MMGVTKYDYMDLNQFITRFTAFGCPDGPMSMGWIWYYMGRDNNARRQREWLVFIPAMPNRKFFVFER